MFPGCQIFVTDLKIEAAQVPQFPGSWWKKSLACIRHTMRYQWPPEGECSSIPRQWPGISFMGPKRRKNCSRVIAWIPSLVWLTGLGYTHFPLLHRFLPMMPLFLKDACAKLWIGMTWDTKILPESLLRRYNLSYWTCTKGNVDKIGTLPIRGRETYSIV